MRYQLGMERVKKERKAVSFRPGQLLIGRRLAAKTGESFSHHIRRAFDEYMVRLDSVSAVKLRSGEGRITQVTGTSHGKSRS